MQRQNQAWSKGQNFHGRRPMYRQVTWFLNLFKIYGVGLVDNRPSTDKPRHFVQKKMTCDMWYVTCDTWHVTRDMWHVIRLGVWTFSQNFSSLDLTVMKISRKRMTQWMNEWMNEWINDEALYRTAPATPGLLNITRIAKSYPESWSVAKVSCCFY